MMRPHFFFFMSASTSRVHRNVPRRLIRIMSSHSWVDMFATSLVVSMPAAFTSTSTGPSAFFTAAKAALTARSSPTSAR